MSSNNQNVLYGGEITDSLENAKSLGEFLYNRLKKYGNRVLLVDGVTSAEITASQLLTQSIRVAVSLKHYGIEPGDSVGICCENRFEVPFVMFGIFFIGATYVPLNPTYSQRELLHACSVSRPKIIFTSYQTLDNLKRITQQQTFIEKIFVFGNECVDDNSFNVFLRNNNAPSNEQFLCSPQNMMENIALVLFSSGTTGVPKGIQQSQYSTWFTGTINILNPISNECRLSVAPWTHGFGCFTVIRTVVHGIKLVSLSKFHEQTYLSCIEKFRVTTLMVVPPLIVLLSKSPTVKTFNTSSLQYAISSSAPLSSEILDELQKQIPQLKVRQYYGMSEGGTFTIQTDTFCKSGSVGVLRTGVYAKLVDVEKAIEVGQNTPGQILIKCPGLMKAYIGDNDSTIGILDKDGWLYTGDIGYYDKNHEWFIVDRLKELIKYKGFQVPPAELEALILSHPLVKDVGVIGVPDDFAGELPMAFVVKHGNCTEKEIIDFVASQTSPAKRLRGGVRFVSQIPKSPTGKILRRVLRDSVSPKSKI